MRCKNAMKKCDEKMRWKKVIQKRDAKSWCKNVMQNGMRKLKTEKGKVKSEKWNVKCEIWNVKSQKWNWKVSRSTSSINYFSGNCQIGNRKIMGEALSYEVYFYIICFVMHLLYHTEKTVTTPSKKCHLAKILRSKIFFGFFFFFEKWKLWQKITSQRIVRFGIAKSWAI